jgi:hypothetical protein
MEGHGPERKRLREFQMERLAGKEDKQGEKTARQRGEHGEEKPESAGNTRGPVRGPASSDPDDAQHRRKKRAGSIATDENGEKKEFPLGDGQLYHEHHDTWI